MIHKLNKKTLAILAVAVFILSLTFANVGMAISLPTWPGVSWISHGATINATKIANMFRYLYDGKADIPPTCAGGNKALQWDGSNWICTTIASSGVAPSQSISCTQNGTTYIDGQVWSKTTGYSSCGGALAYNCSGGYSYYTTYQCNNGTVSTVGSYSSGSPCSCEYR